MNETLDSMAGKKDSTDLLLWLGAVIVAGVGISWLVMTKPWLSEPTTVSNILSSPSRSAVSEQTILTEIDGLATATALDNPLRMALLAYEAGLLVEPEEFSAWHLFTQILETDTNNAAATEGLGKVADELLNRGNSALEQGRLDAVRSIVDRVLGTLPEHRDAQRLAQDLESMYRARDNEKLTMESPNQGQDSAAVVDLALTADAEADIDVAQPVAIDPLVALQASFADSRSENRLLSPPDNNAKYFATLMAAANQNDQRAVEAQKLLFEDFLGRARATIESQDTLSAETWITEADSLAVDSARVDSVRAALTTMRIELESRKPIPASELILRHYVAPIYPTRAASRGIEGWVDIDFIVAIDGTTRDIVVTQATHDSYFRQQAAAAIEQWTFEPRSFLGETIEQRSYTRVAFKLE
jgi:TonB family protein